MCSAQSTEDLFFLIGKWDLEHTYFPGTPEAKTYKGSLTCHKAMDGQYIRCEYLIGRMNTSEGRTITYFNYNSIYKTYEALSLSSTWPIKVTSRGSMKEVSEKKVMNLSSEFLIANNVTEYVRSEVTFDSAKMTMIKSTHIKTSEKPQWWQHMQESAVRSDTIIIKQNKYP